MDKDDLLRRAYKAISEDHKGYISDYHMARVKCERCNLLREIDKSLEAPGHVCDCHPRGGTEGKHLLIDIV